MADKERKNDPGHPGIRVESVKGPGTVPAIAEGTFVAIDPTDFDVNPSATQHKRRVNEWVQQTVKATAVADSRGERASVISVHPAEKLFADEAKAHLILWSGAERAWDHNLTASKALNATLAESLRALDEVGRG